MGDYIVIFLLFFAVLAAGWFYLQRAKARDAAKTTSVESEHAPAETAHSEPAHTEAPPADRQQ